MMGNLVIYDFFVYLFYHATNKNKDKHMIIHNRLLELLFVVSRRW